MYVLIYHFLPLKIRQLYRGFPGGTEVKNPPACAGDTRDTGSIPGSGKIPWSSKWQPTPVLLPGKSHGQRNLVGYSPWNHKDSYTTKRACTCTHTHTHTHIYLHKRTSCKLQLWNLEPESALVRHCFLGVGRPGPQAMIVDKSISEVESKDVAEAQESEAE